MTNNNNTTSSENTTNSTTTNTDSSYSDFLRHVSTPTTAEIRPFTEGFSSKEGTKE